jgi:hypothetical protein
MNILKRLKIYLLNIRKLILLEEKDVLWFLKRLISIKQFKQAVQFVDPLISEKELHRYVNWVFEPKKILSSKINENRQIKMRDYEEIILRLECCACFMH